MIYRSRLNISNAHSKPKNAEAITLLNEKNSAYPPDSDASIAVRSIAAPILTNFGFSIETRSRVSLSAPLQVIRNLVILLFKFHFLETLTAIQSFILTVFGNIKILYILTDTEEPGLRVLFIVISFQITYTIRIGHHISIRRKFTYYPIL